MTLPHFDDVRDIPLTTDADIADRLSLMLDSAIRRQVWLMFLDDDAHQLPVIVPTYVPARPRRDDAVGLGRFIRGMADEVDATTAVLTYERRSGPEITAADRVWLRTLRAACIAAGIQFRGPFLCYQHGVRLVPPDDYAG